MASHDDEHLPDDLRDVARRLHEARTQPTGLELDTLYQRVQRRDRPAGATRRRRGLAFARVNLVAVALTVGLLMTSGASAVIASTALTGEETTAVSFVSITDPTDAAYCQYNDAYSETFVGTSTKGNSSATITVKTDCDDGTVCVITTKGISNYQFSDRAKVELNYETLKICKPRGDATWVRVKAGTTDHYFELPAF